MTERRDLRIGDAEREQVVTLVRHAVGDGRLTIPEGQERIEAALEARTFGDLDPLVADLTPQLPTLVADLDARPAPNRPLDQVRLPGESDPPGWRPDDPLELRAGVDDIRKVGEWTLPPYIRVATGLGDVTMVCLEARAETRVVKIHIDGGAGDVRMILPEGWAVRADRLSGGLGGAHVKVPDRPAPDMPLIEVSGQLTMGDFVARRANVVDRWLLRRRRHRRARQAAIEA